MGATFFAYLWILLQCEALYLLPGVALAAFIPRWKGADRWCFVSIALIGAAFAGYAVFWVYFFNTAAGRWTSYAVPGLSLAVVLWKAKKIWKQDSAGVKECGAWIALILLGAAFYLCLGYSSDFDRYPTAEPRVRLVPWLLPPDNELPLMFARRMYRGEPTRPFLLLDWKASDRPPLQTGLTLAQLPWADEADWPLRYQLLGMILQGTWVAGLGILLRRRGIGPRTTAFTLFFCLLSAVFFVHEFFVWPKLVTAALVLLAISLTPIGDPNWREWTLGNVVSAAAAIALGFLAHPGAVFTIAGMAVALAVARKLPPLRLAAAGVATGLVLVAPWTLYQKFYDPPGDRLAKMHLAGMDQIDDRSLAKDLADAYGKLSLREFLKNKRENLQVLAGPGLLQGRPPGRLSYFLSGQFYSVFQALGILNAGWLLWLYRRLKKKGAAKPATHAADGFLLVAGISMAIWCLAMFPPRSTIIHQGSLADEALIFSALAIYIVEILPWMAAAGLMAAQAVVFAVFAFGTPYMASSMNFHPGFPIRIEPDMSAEAAVCAAAIVLWAWRYTRVPVVREGPAPKAGKQKLRRRR
jgi:hypothetical protein